MRSRITVYFILRIEYLTKIRKPLLRIISATKMHKYPFKVTGKPIEYIIASMRCVRGLGFCKLGLIKKSISGPTLKREHTSSKLKKTVKAILIISKLWYLLKIFQMKIRNFILHSILAKRYAHIYFLPKDS
jgi:hypothetical protein